MNEFIEPNMEPKKEKKTPISAVELRAQYTPEMGEDGKPRGHFLNLIITVGKTEVVHNITAPFNKSSADTTEVVAGSLIFTNPTKPIEMEGGKEHAAVRIELPKAAEEDSMTAIFERESPESDDWRIDEELPTFSNFQDPFHCGAIEGDQVFGGVQTSRKDGKLTWRTVFYRYKESMSELIDSNGELADPFCYGPMGMKDIRLKEISEGRIAVFTRPQGEFGGRGKIGYFEISTLSELEPALQKHIEDKNPSTLIEGLFCDEDWGGTNELHPLSDGRIGVIGHIACTKEDSHNPDHGIKDYYAIAFIFDPETKDFSDLKIIATAEDFPEIEGKKGDIGSVIFSGGIKRLGNGRAIFYGGVKDIKSGYLSIEDPFGDL